MRLAVLPHRPLLCSYSAHSTSAMPWTEMPAAGGGKPPHIAVLPSAGMGHLTPFCRLAATLADRGCEVSFVVVQSMVSSAESLHISALFSSIPQIRPLELRLAPLDSSGDVDPFFLQFEAIRRSAHLLPPLLAASPTPVSALIVDISLASAFVPVTAGIGLPCYILFTSSAMMLSLCAFFPTHIAAKAAGAGDVDIPGIGRVPKSSIPPALHDPTHLFTTQFVTNGRVLVDADGILINTFQALESNALAALNGGSVVAGLPQAIAIGPLRPLPFEGGSPITWLDAQPVRSVVYVCFGSRTAMSRDQIKELGVGLEMSGCRFLWVVKSKKVDRDDEKVELEELLGNGFLERVKDRGLLIKGWVEQKEILKHAAVGGFFSHSGWNSVTEAALHGVRVLAWPRIGDQRVNAEIVRRNGLGVWVEEWSWEAEGKVVKGEEIGKRVQELMEESSLQASVERVADEAARAVAAGGSSDKGLAEFIAKLKERAV